MHIVRVAGLEVTNTQDTVRQSAQNAREAYLSAVTPGRVCGVSLRILERRNSRALSVCARSIRIGTGDISKNKDFQLLMLVKSMWRT